MITRAVDEHPGVPWTEWVADLCMVLNMTIAKSHGYSPYFVVFKGEPSIPSIVNPHLLLGSDDSEPSDAEVAAYCDAVYSVAKTHVLERLTKRDEYAKSHYEKEDTSKPPPIEIDFVIGD
jgi:hypothetical protein